MASKTFAGGLLIGALVLVAGCDSDGPLTPVRNLTAPTPPEPAPAALAVDVTVTSATTVTLQTLGVSEVGEPTSFRVDWQAVVNALNGNVTNITLNAGLTTTTGVTVTGEPISIEWLIPGNPTTVNGTFIGEAPLDDQNQISGQIDVTANGTDMGTGAPVTSSQSGPFSIPVFVQPPPPPGPAGGCTQTGTQGCAHNRFEIDVFASDGSAPAGPRQVEQHFFDGAQFNIFDIPLLVQVQDRCNINGHWAVFVDSVTAADVTVSVTDTSANQSRVYTNPLGNPFPPVVDTTAFATCP